MLFFDFLFSSIKIYAIKFTQFGFSENCKNVSWSSQHANETIGKILRSSRWYIEIDFRHWNSLLTWFSFKRRWFYYNKDERDAGRYRRDKQSQSMRIIWVIYLFTICGVGDVEKEKIQVFFVCAFLFPKSALFVLFFLFIPNISHSDFHFHHFLLMLAQKLNKTFSLVSCCVNHQQREHLSYNNKMFNKWRCTVGNFIIYFLGTSTANKSNKMLIHHLRY